VVIGHPFTQLLGVERNLGPVDCGTVKTGRFAGNGFLAVGIGQVVVKGEPERGAGAGRASGGADALLVDIPFRSLGANELQSASGVFQRRFYRRLNLFFDAMLDEAIVDGDDGDASIEEGLRISFLVAVAPAAAVDIEDYRRRLFRLRLKEIEH